MSIRLGITGGMGSGKTYVCQLLEKRGIPVFNTDMEAKRLIAEDPVVRCALTGIVGDGLYDREGHLNKPVMASYIARGKEWADKVNAVVHPAVRKVMYGWFSAQGNRQLVVVECALLFESGLYMDMDKIVSVIAPLEVRLDRIARRDGCTREHAQKIISLQLTDEYRIRKSDYVIENDGQRDILSQMGFLDTGIL